MESILEILTVDTGQRRVVYRADVHFEAPNWSRDGGALLYNSGGRIYTIGVDGGEPKRLDTGDATRCNNDHGLSPDGRWLAISSATEGGSRIFICPSAGGPARLVTELAPSYWHGWSPDGRRLAYCAQRRGQFDIYSIDVDGGEELQLTNTTSHDDGPDYSPSGEWIYWNSDRSGLMKIWRMRPDGGQVEQVTADPDHADWFPHPSPDGHHLLFLSYDKSVTGHPANKDVSLRIMPLAGGQPKVIATLFGGQGTINVPSWSPDSREVAFVSYRV
jgi:Tol biopolymer transport system component